VQENEFTGCVDKVQGTAPGGKKNFIFDGLLLREAEWTLL
jgi:hypothetical protein